MSSPPGPDWPTDPTALACIVADAARPQAERTRALVELRAFHQNRAQQAASTRRRGRDTSLRDDLAAWAEEQLWAGRFSADGPSYPAWCRRVMANRLTDLFRRMRSEEPSSGEPAYDDTPEQGAAGGWTEDVARTLDWAAPFSPADRARVAAWPNTLHRVAVLCRGLLWRKVPEVQWGPWLAECGLVPPFPPDGFRDLPEDERNALLAECLRLSLSNLHQIWKRGKDRHLPELDFLREQAP